MNVQSNQVLTCQPKPCVPAGKQSQSGTPFCEILQGAENICQTYSGQTEDTKPEKGVFSLLDVFYPDIADIEICEDELLEMMAVAMVQPVPIIIPEIVRQDAGATETVEITGVSQATEGLSFAQAMAQTPETRSEIQPQTGQTQQVEGSAQPVLDATGQQGDKPVLTARVVTDEATVADDVTMPDQSGAAPEVRPGTEGQQRFDNMVKDAADRLQAMQPVAEENEARPVVEEDEAQPVEVKASEPKMPLTSERTRETDIRRSEETIQNLMTAPSEKPTQTQEIKAPQPVQQTQAAEAPTPANQVEAKITEEIGTGRTEFEMQLNPQELGKVSVRMILENGRLAIQLEAATQAAMQSLRRESEVLLASLRIQGVQVENITVVQEAQPPSGDMQSPFGMQTGHSHQENTEPRPQSKAGETAARPGDAETMQAHPTAPDRLLDTAV
jgi:flagellar hook-length control protein FliK